jgi:hypothetical protein
MMQTAQQQLQALYVTWQEPTSREYFPVGRLVSGLRPDQPNYEFSYLRGVAKAQVAGFQPFPSFDDLNRVYRADDLFPMFENRVMSSGRADYRQYVASLALDPDNDNAMTILTRSGGGRTTDSVEMFEMPRFNAEGNPYRTHFLAHGLGYLHPSSLQRISELQPGDRLKLMCDCQNDADHWALALRSADRVIVGYMPRYLVGDAVSLLNGCEIVHCYVAQVNPPSAPLQQRLLCRLEACWPSNFQPFASDTYQPIPADTTDLRRWSQWPQD